MKVAILGDFHFGYDRFYDDSFIQAESALLKAQELADLIIVAGDIFDSRTPKQEAIARAFEVFGRVHKKIIVIPGTHERRPQGFTNPVDLLCKAGFAESCHAKAVVFEKDGERVAVYGLAGVPEEYAKAAIERLAPRPVEGAFNIFMFHQNLKEIMPVVEHGLFLEDLPDGFDLYVNGHIHKNYELEKGGKHLLIPGSTVMTQVRDEEKEKGFYVYDTGTRSFVYVTIVTRPFVHRTLTIGKETLNIEQALINELSTIDLSKKPIVRIDVETDGAIDTTPINALKSSYSEKCHLIIGFSKESGEDAFNDLDSIGQQNVSIRERGMFILREALGRKNVDISNVEELFDIMCDADDAEQIGYLLRMAGKERGHTGL